MTAKGLEVKEYDSRLNYVLPHRNSPILSCHDLLSHSAAFLASSHRFLPGVVRETVAQALVCCAAEHSFANNYLQRFNFRRHCA
jgi:hypothetical protein